MTSNIAYIDQIEQDELWYNMSTSRVKIKARFTKAKIKKFKKLKNGQE